MAASACSQGRAAAQVGVGVHHTNGVSEALQVTPLPAAEIPAAWHV